MATMMQSTVDRLDRPSAYYLGRVSLRLGETLWPDRVLIDLPYQNKKRKFDRDRGNDERDGNEPKVEEPDPLKDATTLYVGNLYVVAVCYATMQALTLCRSFYTTEEQIHELFSKYDCPNPGRSDALIILLDRCGEIKRLVMGLDRFQKTPCGFCFVEYYTHQDALDCMKYIGGTKLDERIIRTDLDPGFQEGRQYGYVSIPD